MRLRRILALLVSAALLIKCAIQCPPDRQCPDPNANADALWFLVLASARSPAVIRVQNAPGLGTVTFEILDATLVVGPGERSATRVFVFPESGRYRISSSLLGVIRDDPQFDFSSDLRDGVFVREPGVLVFGECHLLNAVSGRVERIDCGE